MVPPAPSKNDISPDIAVGRRFNAVQFADDRIESVTPLGSIDKMEPVFLLFVGL